MALEVNGTVAYEKKIVLKCPSGYQLALDQMVDNFLRDGVEIVCVTGKDASKVEDIVDELVVGNGDDPSRFLVTTNHKSLDDAVEFAKAWKGESDGKVQIVRPRCGPV